MKLPPHPILFEAIVGSRAYGTAHAESDEDIKGVYVQPTASLLTLTERPEQYSDERGDRVFYSLSRFLKLAEKANPNIIEMLFMPEDCVRSIHPAFREVLDARNLFITRQVYQSHVNYARAQIRKARGQNKWVNNPQPETAPSCVDFCWYLPRENAAAMPYRPIPAADCGFPLAECHAAAVEHAVGLYRLYHYGDQSKGLFANDQIVCRPIPIDDEDRRCLGLLLFNENAYDRARRDHKHYWTWREQRNEQRWQTQESGQLDYDAKNMMHMFRLLESARHILAEGTPLVRFHGEKLGFLKSILAGRHSYDSLIEKADALTGELDALHATSQLPEQADPKALEALLHSVTRNWESAHV